MAGPLSGVRILDLTTVVMGPYATQILGELGAQVLKVEPPEGDNLRYVGATRHLGMGSNFLHLNRNKRSIVLDLKQAAGREALLRLARTADALIYNVRPQAMARLRLAYEDLAAVNPRLIYVGVYGFGQRGPYAPRPAYDDLVQGAVAIPSLIDEATGGGPQLVPLTLCDRIVGINAVYAVTAALFHRERTGEGQSVEVPMLESMAQFVLGDHMGGRTFDPPAGPPGYPRLLVKERRPYRTRDGYLCLLIYNDKQWQAFFKLIGREAMFRDDARFSSHENRARNIAAVYAFVAEQMTTRTNAEWLTALDGADIPVTPLNSLDDLLADPHLNQTGFFSWVEHPTEGKTRAMAVPSQWSKSQPGTQCQAPRLGEHSAEILHEAGYSQQEIARLVADRVTAVPQEP